MNLLNMVRDLEEPMQDMPMSLPGSPTSAAILGSRIGATERAGVCGMITGTCEYGFVGSDCIYDAPK